MPGSYYGWPKNVLHYAGLQESILDINATVRPQFAIVDGIVGMEGDGPILGTAKTAGVLVVGTNLPAVDATAARVMGIDPARIRYLAEADGWLGPIAEEAIHQVGETLAERPHAVRAGREDPGAQGAARQGVGRGVLSNGLGLRWRHTLLCSGSCLARFPWVLALRKRAPGPWEPSVQPPLVGTAEREEEDGRFEAGSGAREDGVGELLHFSPAPSSRVPETATTDAAAAALSAIRTRCGSASRRRSLRR